MTPNPTCDECHGTGIENLLSVSVLCGVCMTDIPKPPDTDKTPVEPAIRRSSAKHDLGLVACPECLGSGHVKVADLDTVCTWCDGGKMVSHFTVAQWELSKGKLADSSNPPPPPPTEKT